MANEPGLPPLGAVFRERYRLEGILGEGGFARVYLAADTQLNREVAVKMLKRSSKSGYETAAARFDREMRLVANLDSPYIAKLFDFGRDENSSPYMVFELVPGQDLTQVLKHIAPLPEPVVLHILTQLCEALTCAHDASLLHRDVKPGNIRIYEYLDDKWRAKLLDFGIARTSDDDSGLTATGMVVGTPAYMPPEQLGGDPLSPSTDLYGVALIGIEMLTGRPSDNLRRLAKGETVRVPAEVEVSDELRAILDRMLSFTATKRFARAEDVRRQLVQCQSGRGEPVDPDTADTIPTPERSLPEPRSDETPHSTTQEGRDSSLFAHRGLIGVIFLIVGAIALAGLVLGSMMKQRTVAPAPAKRVLPVASTDSPKQNHDPAPRETPPAARTEPDEIDETSERTDGCGRTPPRLGTHKATHDAGLGNVQWTQFVPSKYDADARHPLVVLLHDDLGSGRDFLVDSRFDQIGEQNRFVVVAPTDASAKLYAWRTVGSLTYAEEVIHAARQKLCIDPSRIYVVGHGAGGIVADALACGDTVSAVALVAYIPWSGTFKCDLPEPVPALFAGPMQSGHTPPNGGVDCVNRDKISFRRFDKLWHERNRLVAEPRKVHVEDTGHCNLWSGSAPYLSCRLQGGRPWPGAPARRRDFLGCDGAPADYPLSQITWDFFASLDSMGEAAATP